MEAILEYWDRVDYTSCESKIKYEETLTANSEIEMFEEFYKKNNRLRYCNGSYFKFKDDEWSNKYSEWLKSDDYKKKSFNLYYGGGVVD
jgi:hypothetical protein